MKSVKIKSINKIQHTSKRYDITVAENHNFFANNILVHNCQNLSTRQVKEICTGQPFTKSEKLEGSSITIYLNEDEFGICSRNINFDLESCDNTYTRTANKYNLEEQLRSDKIQSLVGNIAIQGELIGPGIQGNIYGLKDHEIRVFNIYLIDDRTYADVITNNLICQRLGLPEVPFLEVRTFGKEDVFNVNELLEKAEGKSDLNPKVEREGVVYKNHDNSISFKVISNKYLLKYKS